MKRNLYYLLLCVLLLSACSGARYGHYGYVKKNDKVTTKQKHEKKKQVCLNKTENITEPIASKTELPIISDSIPNSFSVNSEVNQVTESTKNELIQTRKNVVKRQESKTILEPKREVQHNEDKPPRVNQNARTAFIFSLVAILFLAITYFSHTLVLLALVGALGFGVAAFVLAIVALDEMKKKSDEYANRGEAIFALIMGSLFVIGGVVLILIAALFLVIFLALL